MHISEILSLIVIAITFLLISFDNYIRRGERYLRLLRKNVFLCCGYSHTWRSWKICKGRWILLNRLYEFRIPNFQRYKANNGTDSSSISFFLYVFSFSSSFAFSLRMVFFSFDYLEWKNLRKCYCLCRLKATIILIEPQIS